MKNVCVPNPMNTIQVCHNIIFSIVGGTQNNVEIDDVRNSMGILINQKINFINLSEYCQISSGLCFT